jgi:hypothetical protein
MALVVLYFKAIPTNAPFFNLNVVLVRVSMYLSGFLLINGNYKLRKDMIIVTPSFGEISIRDISFSEI